MVCSHIKLSVAISLCHWIRSGWIIHKITALQFEDYDCQ